MCLERSRVVGYFPNWARYRKGEGEFTINDIDPSLYTHLIYSFAILDESTFSIKAIDQWADIDDEGFKKTINLKTKNPKLKVMIALGGWTDSTENDTDKYSRLVASTQNINKFVKSVMDFFQKYNFDGLDLDWEFPKTQADKNGFTNLMVALRKAFNQTHLLTAAVPATVDAIDKGYDVPSMNENLDFINVMAYDFHGSWEKNADHHSPLYKRPGETNNLNIDSGINYWISKGMPASKITMGIPLYGRSWTLSSEIATPPAPAQGPGTAGLFTKEAGHMAYYEICRAISNDKWSVFRDPNKKIGPIAVSPTVPKMWVGYDDPDMAIIKTKYILSKGLGGAMLWDISTDDFRSTYSEKPNPITSAIVTTLRGTRNANDSSCRIL